MKEEFNSTKNVFEELKGYNRKLEDDLNNSLQNVKELGLKLKDTENKITGLETEYENYKNQTAAKEKESESIKNDLEANIVENEKELESMKNELKVKITEKEKELESMKSEFMKIANIKEEYEQKIKANESKISDLQTRNQGLEAQMQQAINIPKLLKEVREVLAHKGFISEMEFENIMKQL